MGLGVSASLGFLPIYIPSIKTYHEALAADERLRALPYPITQTTVSSPEPAFHLISTKNAGSGQFRFFEHMQAYEQALV